MVLSVGLPRWYCRNVWGLWLSGWARRKSTEPITLQFSAARAAESSWDLGEWRSGNRSSWLDRPEVERGGYWVQQLLARGSGRECYSEWPNNTLKTRGTRLSVGNRTAKTWRVILVKNSPSCFPKGGTPSIQPWFWKDIASTGVGTVSCN